MASIDRPWEMYCGTWNMHFSFKKSKVQMQLASVKPASETLQPVLALAIYADD
ncbi:hypothetical protein Hanom_Chr13g01200191 [Helianthus anomalus]